MHTLDSMFYSDRLYMEPYFIKNVMESIKKVKVEAPIKRGEIIVENVEGLGVNVIATKNIKRV